MDIGIVGSGPAADAFRGACTDIDAGVREAPPERLGDVDLGAVIAPAGADAFVAANAAADRWIAVEIGGLGGHALSIDAGVTVFDRTAGSGCYDCLRRRVASNSRETEGRPSGDRSAVRFAGAIAGREAVRLFAGADRGGTIVEVPGPDREFLPVQGCDCGPSRDRTAALDHESATLDDALARAERALDDRVGALSEVGERESFPVPYYLAATADTSAFSDARAAEYAAGVDPNWDRAFMKALGEGLERYAAGIYRAREFTTAPERTRANAVSPGRFVRPDDYRTPDPAEPIHWVESRDLLAGESVALPAEFVHYPPPTERYKPPITTGLGLGNSGVEAVLSGLYEVVERDAAMLAWYSTFEPLELSVDDDGFAELCKRARAEGLSVTPLLLTQDVDVPVVAAAVHREGDWPRFAVGSDAALDPVAAARGALAEALQNWMELRTMGPEQAVEEEGAIGEYADFPAAARSFVDAAGAVPAESAGPETVPEGEAELDALLDRAADAGLDAYAARVTTRDIERLGFEAYRALVPTAQPLFTGEPFFGDRARDVPRELGFEPELDRSYHPFP